MPEEALAAPWAQERIAPEPTAWGQAACATCGCRAPVPEPRASSAAGSWARIEAGADPGPAPDADARRAAVREASIWAEPGSWRKVPKDARACSGPAGAGARPAAGRAPERSVARGERAPRPGCACARRAPGSAGWAQAAQSAGAAPGPDAARRARPCPCRCGVAGAYRGPRHLGRHCAADAACRRHCRIRSVPGGAAGAACLPHPDPAASAVSAEAAAAGRPYRPGPR